MISINAHRLTETIESIQKAFLIMNWGSNVFLKNHKRFLKRVRWSAEKPSSPTLTPAPVEAARDPALHLEMRGGPSRTSGKGERLKQEVAAEGEVRPLPWRHWSFWSQKKGAPWDSKIMYLEIEKKLILRSTKTECEVGVDVVTLYTKLLKIQLLLWGPVSSMKPCPIPHLVYSQSQIPTELLHVFRKENYSTLL